MVGLAMAASQTLSNQPLLEWLKPADELRTEQLWNSLSPGVQGNGFA